MVATTKLGATGRHLGARPRDLDVKGATSSVEILHALEDVLGSLPVAAPQVPPPAPPPPLADLDADIDIAPPPPPLVAGYADPEPIEPVDLGEVLLEPILVLEDLEPVGELQLVCSVCGRSYFLPDELDDDRLLTTCDRCL